MYIYIYTFTSYLFYMKLIIKNKFKKYLLSYMSYTDVCKEFRFKNILFILLFGIFLICYFNDLRKFIYLLVNLLAFLLL